MSEHEQRIPWNANIRQTVMTLIDEIGTISGIPLQIHHVPSDENLLNSLACERDLVSCPFITHEIRIGGELTLLVKGYSERGVEDTVLKTALNLLKKVLALHLQNQAEIESFSKEIVDNYQTINMLYRVSDALGQIEDVNRVASIILNQAVSITHAERGSVLLLDQSEKHLVVAASHGFDEEPPPSFSLDISDTLCAETLRTGRPIIVENIKDRPDLAVYSKGAYKTGSFIAVPLRKTGDKKDKRFLGVLNLSDKVSSASFKSNDLKLLSALAAQASVAIANAQTLQKLKESKAKVKKTLHELMITYENLEKRAVVIDQINKISLAINATLDLDQLFEKISLYAKKITNAEEAAVYYREGTAVTEPQIPGSVSSQEAEEINRAWNRLLDFPDFYNKEQVIFLDHPESFTHLPLRKGGKVAVRNLLGVPFFKGDAIGIIAVVNKSASEMFTEEDAEHLKVLGNQASIAVANAKLIADQKARFLDTIVALAAAVDAKDPYTHNHSRNVSSYSRAIAEQMFLSEREMEILELSAILHDIGKIAIPESILNKPAKLTDEEFDIMKSHPLCGVKIVENIEEMEEIIPGMKYHHERYDGKGYPEGLKGDEIPLLAQIMAVADTYDAITSDRPYRKGPGHEFAEKEIIRCSGTQFSPTVTEAFLKSSICKEMTQEAVTKL